MIINRRTFIPKRGRGLGREALELAKAEFARLGFKGTARFYLSSLGPLDVIGFEAEYENLEEYARVQAETNPRVSPEFWKKSYELTENGGTNEIWTLV